MGEETRAAAGGYVFTKEARMDFNGKEILYLMGYGRVDATCCGEGGCGYIFVPGYIDRWKYKTTDKGISVSSVVPVSDAGEQEELKKMLMKKEFVPQVIFQ